MTQSDMRLEQVCTTGINITEDITRCVDRCHTDADCCADYKCTRVPNNLLSVSLWSRVVVHCLLTNQPYRDLGLYSCEFGW